MRMRMGVILLSVCASVWARTQDLTVRTVLPNAFKLDGLVGEWSGTAPQIELGPGNQVAGKSKTNEPSDFSAKVWLVFSREGMVLAAAVTDDSLMWPSAAADVVNRDHAELWIAFPAAAMPVLGYSHILDGGEDTEMESEKACESDKRITDVAKCKEWFRRQKKWRQILSRFFVRQYLISPAAVQESFFSQCPSSPRPDDIPFAWPEGARNSMAKVVPHSGGYSLEALIPLSDLPPLAQNPLTTFRMMVDFADCDSRSGPIDGLFSSASQRKFADISTFNAVRLDRPRLFESKPPLVASMFSEYTAPFIFPADPIRSVYCFNNRVLGYDDIPSYDSPTIKELKIPERPLRRVYGFDLYLAPEDVSLSNGIRSRLVAVRQGKAVASYEFHGPCAEDHLEKILEKSLKSCKLLVFVSSGKYNPVGFGACGACPTMAFEVVAIDAAGNMRFVDENQTNIFCEGLDIEMLPTTDAYFGFRCVPDPDQVIKPAEGEWKIAWSKYDSACDKLRSPETKR